MVRSLALQDGERTVVLEATAPANGLFTIAVTATALDEPAGPRAARSAAPIRVGTGVPSAPQGPRRAPSLSGGGADAPGPRPRHPRSDHRSDGRSSRRRGAAFGAGARRGGDRRRRAVAVRADPRRRRSRAGRHDGDDELLPAGGTKLLAVSCRRLRASRRNRWRTLAQGGAAFFARLDWTAQTQSTVDGSLRLVGGVELGREDGGWLLSADEILLDPATSRIVATGNIVFETAEFHVIAERIEVRRRPLDAGQATR